MMIGLRILDRGHTFQRGDPPHPLPRFPPPRPPPLWVWVTPPPGVSNAPPPVGVGGVVVVVVTGWWWLGFEQVFAMENHRKTIGKPWKTIGNPWTHPFGQVGGGHETLEPIPLGGGQRNPGTPDHKYKYIYIYICIFFVVRQF